MNRILRYAAAACGIALLLVASACADDTAADPTATHEGDLIEVVSAYIPAPPTHTAAAYVVFRNHSDEADRLLSASADVTDTVELHQTSMDGGTMTMIHVDAIDLPAGGELLMEPGGYHVMLIEVTRELHEGDSVQMTFTFEHHGTVDFSVPVVASSGEPAGGHGAH
ncbi:MAG: copper chaperone PCu(A)C [Dehalococcoidia bacterium]|nr:copper chaperone PCu(A)C [Dehalococcoidia bacterium]